VALDPWLDDALPFSIFDEDGTPEHDATVQVITFRLGATWCGVDVGDIAGVEGDLEMTEIPRAAPWLLGIANLHGEIASVVDLAALLDMAETTGSSSVTGRRSLVCRARDNTFVLEVAEARRIVRVPVEEIRSPSGTFESDVAAHLRGVYVHDSTPLYILDVPSILTSRTLLEGAVL